MPNGRNFPRCFFGIRTCRTGWRPVGPRLQVPRQRFQPPVHPERLDVRDRLAVHPGRAAVATNGLPGDREHVIAPHLVAQRVEPEVRSFLRFRM